MNAAQEVEFANSAKQRFYNRAALYEEFFSMYENAIYIGRLVPTNQINPLIESSFLTLDEFFAKRRNGERGIDE